MAPAELGDADDFSHIRALVVDDDPDILALIEHVIRDLGITRLRGTTDPLEAKRLIEATPDGFEVVLCDWSMPQMSGLDFLKWVRGATQNVTFVMLTGNTATDAVEEAKKFNVDGYVAKPFRPSELKARLINLLRRAGRSQGADKRNVNG
jgi:DNA-binding response OmpR family regulator